VDLGFNPDRILLVTLRIGNDAGPEGFGLLERVRERLAAVPAVEAASYARRIPGATLMASTRLRRDAQRATTGFVRQVGPDYLRVLGLRVITGRELTAGDRRGGTRVAIINQTLAAELFGNEPPIGQQLTIGDREQVEIVGIVSDALFDGPNRDPRPRYVFQTEQQMPGGPPADPHFFIRHRGSLDAITPLVTRAIREVDAGVPVVAMSTMTARLALVVELEALIVRLLAGFAAISLVIAAFGHYAVAMFNMRRRTREFGVRMALGASTGRIHATVVRESIAHAIAGIVIGLALSVALAIGFRSTLFGVTPVDPITYVSVVALLAVTSVVASYLPALRASRVNVVEALRQE
jgi:ABC-type antimicrobial peptide transport system permease subunit